MHSSSAVSKPVVRAAFHTTPPISSASHQKFGSDFRAVQYGFVKNAPLTWNGPSALPVLAIPWRMADHKLPYHCHALHTTQPTLPISTPQRVSRLPKAATKRWTPVGCQSTIRNQWSQLFHPSKRIYWLGVLLCVGWTRHQFLWRFSDPFRSSERDRREQGQQRMSPTDRGLLRPWTYEWGCNKFSRLGEEDHRTHLRHGSDTSPGRSQRLLIRATSSFQCPTIRATLLLE